MGLCDQSAFSREAVMAKSRRLLMDSESAEQKTNVGDDTFCAFCNMAVSYMKVISRPKQRLYKLKPDCGSNVGVAILNTREIIRHDTTARISDIMYIDVMRDRGRCDVVFGRCPSWSMSCSCLQ